MASITKLNADGEAIPKGSDERPAKYRARWRTPEGKSRSQTFSKWKEAEACVTGKEHSKLTGGYVDPAAGRVTFAEWSEQWLAKCVDLKPRTLHG